MRLGVTQVECIDDHADVRRVLARLAHMGNFDQLEVGLVHTRFEPFVTLPVAIGLLEDDAALEQQALENRFDVKLFQPRLAHAERDVLEVAKDRHAESLRGCPHEYLLAYQLFEVYACRSTPTIPAAQRHTAHGSGRVGECKVIQRNTTRRFPRVRSVV